MLFNRKTLTFQSAVTQYLPYRLQITGQCGEHVRPLRQSNAIDALKQIFEWRVKGEQAIVRVHRPDRVVGVLNQCRKSGFALA